MPRKSDDPAPRQESEQLPLWGNVEDGKTSSEKPASSDRPPSANADAITPAETQSPPPKGERIESPPGRPHPKPLPGGEGASSPPRLSDLIPRFLEFAAAIDRSPHTIKTTRIDLALLVRFLGDRQAALIGLDDLRRYAAWLDQERKNDPRSRRRKIASIKAFFAYLRNTGIRVDDPAEPLIYPAAEPHLPEFLEPDEVARLIAAAGRPMWRALILTLLDTGLKRDELLALHPADVYLDPQQPDRSYLAVRATDQARRVRARTLRLTPRLVAELGPQIETGASERLFPISVRAVNAIVETTGERAGLRKRGAISPQMLRDTFAVQEVRRRLTVEVQADGNGAGAHEVTALRARHDLEVCELLGLNAGGLNDPIARYRILAAASRPGDS